MRLRDIASTSQDALLERFLARLRCHRLRGRYNGKRVLDFGCGQNGWAVTFMAQKAELVHGVDASLQELVSLSSGAKLFRSIDDLPDVEYDLVTALAVFEHIPPFELVALLDELYAISAPGACIFGTVPTPSARPVLEFLSFQLGLIDSSQIRDHWVYYDDLWLKEIIALTRWRVDHYNTFQFGLNSEFVLVKQ